MIICINKTERSNLELSTRIFKKKLKSSSLDSASGTLSANTSFLWPRKLFLYSYGVRISIKHNFTELTMTSEKAPISPPLSEALNHHPDHSMTNTIKFILAAKLKNEI